MGGRDKGLLELRGRPLAAYALDAVKPVAGTVLISANRNLGSYSALGCPVISDRTGGFRGPLAGLLSAMESTATADLLVVPCDCPLLDAAVLRRILQALADQAVDVAVAYDGQRLQPVVMALRTDLSDSVEAFLESGERQLKLWLQRQRWVAVDCGDRAEAFENVNTPEDLARLEDRLRAAR
jgi:molybdopterin-guanine dinucleotide biosynthesis protein A